MLVQFIFLEPTPGTHCPLASSLGTNIFLASLRLLVLAQVIAQFNFEFYNQNGWSKSYCVILWLWFWLHSSKWTRRKASSASDIFSTDVRTNSKLCKCLKPSSVTDSEKWVFYNYPCAFLVLASIVRSVMQILVLTRPYLANSFCKYL